jgi:predicted component of type VI protein secretion system
MVPKEYGQREVKITINYKCSFKVSISEIQTFLKMTDIKDTTCRTIVRDLETLKAALAARSHLAEGPALKFQLKINVQ